MRPVKIDLVMDYAKKGKFMPPKATWFEPKPLDGIFFHHWYKAQIVHVKRCIKYKNKQILKNEIKQIICQLPNGRFKKITDLYDSNLVEFGTHNCPDGNTMSSEEWAALPIFKR